MRLRVQTIRWLVAIIVLFCPAFASANAGVFSGSGQTIKLVSTEKIQLVQEEVHIKTAVLPALGMPSIDWAYIAYYHCQFQLRNLSDAPAEVKVGFPLNAQFFDSPYPPEMGRRSAEELGFKAKTIDGKVYQTEWQPRDEQNKFSSLFLWKMPFAPRQTIDLVVEYEMPFSMGLGSTARGHKQYAKAWYSQLAFSISTGISYVTETGKSWKGPIEKALFEVDLRSVERDMQTKGRNACPSSPKTEALKQVLQNLYRSVSPRDWKEDRGILRWEFANYSPSDPIRIAYYPISIPKNAEHCKIVMAKLLVDKLTTEDLLDFREIVAAYYGQEPTTPRVKEFVENQVWYPGSKDSGAAGADVLAYLDSAIKLERRDSH